MKPVPPSASVDVFAVPAARESAGWQTLSLLPLAAFVFALVAWGVTGFLAYGSESQGIAGATVAMFPTGFGTAGVIARRLELSMGSSPGGDELASKRPPSALRLLLISGAGGVLSMILFGGFMSAVWPSL